MSKKYLNALKINSQIEEYKVLSVLGAGGFGITYLCLDTQENEKVVLKEYLPSSLATRQKNDTTVSPLSKDEEKDFYENLEKFYKEAEILSHFNHPNIVQIKSIFEANNTAYFTMKYEQSQDLQHYIKGLERALTQNEIMDIIIPLLNALKEVHKQNILHRDIKPSNILIRQDGSPVLIDFGAARNTVGRKTNSLTALLTDGYAPFEQYNTSKSKQGPYTDIYAIGAMMYQMATGKRPVNAQTRAGSLIDMEPDPFIPLSDHNPVGFDDKFVKAVDLALKFSVKDRPRTIDEFLEILPDKSIKIKKKNRFYRDDIKEVVINVKTNLMWQDNGNGNHDMSWDEAFEYAKKLNREKFARFDDWRVPTIEEYS